MPFSSTLSWCIIKTTMATAHLPSRKTSKTPAKTRSDAIRKLIKRGWTSQEIAEHLGGGDERRIKTIRTQILRIIGSDKEIGEHLALVTTGSMREALPATGDGLGRRAGRGRVGEAKLLMEATGFHSSRQRHEHTGKIEISISAPRPEPVAQIEEQIVDAEVVED
jgi:hypothetical protein